MGQNKVSKIPALYPGYFIHQHIWSVIKLREWCVDDTYFAFVVWCRNYVWYEVLVTSKLMLQGVPRRHNARVPNYVIL